MTDYARVLWLSNDLSVKDEPLLLALLKYRQSTNRHETGFIAASVPPTSIEEDRHHNLFGSKTFGGGHLPIIDLDFSHHYVPSSTPGHGHLFLNERISGFRWFVLMCALRYARVLNRGGFWWTLRRGQNFVRIGSKVEPNPFYYTYGWLFRKRKFRGAGKGE